jgi:outer membrane protein OmpA-like peptidoglycan-associated protein
MKTANLSVLFMVAFSTGIYAGPLDDLNQVANQVFGEVIAHKASEAAKAKANKILVIKLNKKLLIDSRNNQCQFKEHSPQLINGCDHKIKRLASAVLSAKKILLKSAKSEFKFNVLDYMNAHDVLSENKALSKKRAQTIVEMLILNGISSTEIEAVDTDLKKDAPTLKKSAENAALSQRYEVRISI